MAAHGVGNPDNRETEPGGFHFSQRGTHEVAANEDTVRDHHP